MKRISYKFPVCFSTLLFFPKWISSWCIRISLSVMPMCGFWMARKNKACLSCGVRVQGITLCVIYCIIFRRELVGQPINWHDDLFSSARNSQNEYLFNWTGVCQDHTNNARMPPWKDTVKGCKVDFTTWKGPPKCCVDWMGFCGIFPPILFSLMILVQPKRTVLKSAEAVQTESLSRWNIDCLCLSSDAATNARGELLEEDLFWLWFLLMSG